jgi:hypothetical protein
VAVSPQGSNKIKQSLALSRFEAHVRRAMREDRFNLYRRKAEEYPVKAEKAVGEYDKAAWLKLAEDWQQLADVFVNASLALRHNQSRPPGFRLPYGGALTGWMHSSSSRPFPGTNVELCDYVLQGCGGVSREARHEDSLRLPCRPDSV